MSVEELLAKYDIMQQELTKADIWDMDDAGRGEYEGERTMLFMIITDLSELKESIK